MGAIYSLWRNISLTNVNAALTIARYDTKNVPLKISK